MNGSCTFRSWFQAITLAATLAWLPANAQDADTTPVPDATPEAPVPPIERRSQRVDDVVAVGSDTVIEAQQVSHEVVVVRGNARIEGDVDGDVVVVFGKLTMSGNVRGDVVVVLGEAEIDGVVRGDVATIFTRASLGPDAELRGEMVAVGHPPLVDPGAKLRHHPRIYSFGPVARYADWGKDYLLQGVLLLRPFPPRLSWVWVLGAFLLGFHLVVAAVFARPLMSCMEILRNQPARSFLVGLLACVLVGPLSLLLSFTIVAPLLIGLTFLAFCVFGRVAAYAAVGSALGRGTGIPIAMHPVPAVLAGSLLFYVSYMIPFVGYLVYWLVLPWGVGGALMLMFESLRREERPTGGAGRTAGVYGGLAAAGGLASGGPAPATHAIVGDSPIPPGQPPIPPVGETFFPPSTPSPGLPPLVPLTGVELAALPRAGFWIRLAAAAIDLGMIAFATAMLNGHPRMFWILVGLYHLVMWTWKSTTIGGAILGLRLIRMDGRRIDWTTSGVRLLGCLVSLLALGLGFFWVAWDSQLQSWHDRIAGTTIVKMDRRMPLV